VTELTDAELAFLEKAAEIKGKSAEATKAAGISRATFYRYLPRLKILAAAARNPPDPARKARMAVAA
jgi:transcriptional regulator of acetoin/glycerol metabolism